MKKHSSLTAKLTAGVIFVAGTLLAITNIETTPYTAFGGAIWLKNGIHYLSDEDITKRILDINSPYETSISEKIKESTPMCDQLEEGFCQISPGFYNYKLMITPAVAYVPAVPDRKEVIGYCTLCNDGTFSPSCAVGRGACSWHDGVASYNVEKYRIIPGTPAVEARPANYSYESKSYVVSPLYVRPSKPSLEQVAAFE